MVKTQPNCSSAIKATEAARGDASSALESSTENSRADLRAGQVLSLARRGVEVHTASLNTFHLPRKKLNGIMIIFYKRLL